MVGGTIQRKKTKIRTPVVIHSITAIIKAINPARATLIALASSIEALVPVFSPIVPATDLGLGGRSPSIGHLHLGKMGRPAATRDH